MYSCADEDAVPFYWDCEVRITDTMHARPDPKSRPVIPASLAAPSWGCRRLERHELALHLLGYCCVNAAQSTTSVLSDSLSR